MISNKRVYTMENNAFDSSDDHILSVDGDESTAISFSSNNEDDTDISLEELDTYTRNYLNGYLALSNAKAYAVEHSSTPLGLKVLTTTLEMVNSTLKLKSKDTYVITVESNTYLSYTITIEAADGMMSKIWEGIKTFFKKIWDGITSLFSKTKSKNAEEVKKIETSSAEIVNLQKQVEATKTIEVEDVLSVEVSMGLVKPLSGFIYKNPTITIQQLQTNIAAYFSYTASNGHPILAFIDTLTSSINSIISIMQAIPSGPATDTNSVIKMTSSEAEVKINEVLLKNGFAKYSGLVTKLNIDVSKLNGDTSFISNKYYIPLGIHNDEFYIYIIGTKDFPGEDKDRYKSSIEKLTIKPEVYSKIRLPVMKNENDISVYSKTAETWSNAVTSTSNSVDTVKNKTNELLNKVDAEVKRQNDNIPRNFIDFANTIITGYLSALNIYAHRLYGTDLITLSNYFDAVKDHYNAALAVKNEKAATNQAEADKTATNQAAANQAEVDKAAADQAAANQAAADKAEADKPKGFINRAKNFLGSKK